VATEPVLIFKGSGGLLRRCRQLENQYPGLDQRQPNRVIGQTKDSAIVSSVSCEEGVLRWPMSFSAITIRRRARDVLSIRE